jgi:hypothetical protein
MNVMRIATFLLVAGLLSAQQPTYDFTELDRILTAAQSRISGGFELILTQHGQVIFQKTYGPIAANQTYAIASSSKWLSAAVVMTAVDDRRVSLNDKLSKFLPYFNGEKEPITLSQAFSHTRPASPVKPHPPRKSLASTTAAPRSISARSRSQRFLSKDLPARNSLMDRSPCKPPDA